MKELKIHLGCGSDYKQGFVNVDCAAGVADVVADLNKPWPFADGSADYIYSSHCFEHLNERGFTLSEAHRVLKAGGRLEFYVPYAWSTAAFQDPTHKCFWMPETIEYFNIKVPHMLIYFPGIEFNVITNELLDQGLHTCGSVHFTSRLHKLRNLIPFRRILKRFLLNMYDELHVVLEKPKNK
ncbi:MAG: class I SAM-dependent methyltransferase [Limisphaerales bacterium]